MKGSGRMLMKKKLLASFCALLLVPTMAVASTNMVSISELYKKAAEMGRWRRTYEIFESRYEGLCMGNSDVGT